MPGFSRRRDEVCPVGGAHRAAAWAWHQPRNRSLSSHSNGPGVRKSNPSAGPSPGSSSTRLRTASTIGTRRRPRCYLRGRGYVASRSSPAKTSPAVSAFSGLPARGANLLEHFDGHLAAPCSRLHFASPLRYRHCGQARPATAVRHHSGATESNVGEWSPGSSAEHRGHPRQRRAFLAQGQRREGMASIVGSMTGELGSPA